MDYKFKKKKVNNNTFKKIFLKIKKPLQKRGFLLYFKQIYKAIMINSLRLFS